MKKIVSTEENKITKKDNKNHAVFFSMIFIVSIAFIFGFSLLFMLYKATNEDKDIMNNVGLFIQVLLMMMIIYIVFSRFYKTR